VSLPPMTGGGKLSRMLRLLIEPRRRVRTAIAAFGLTLMLPFLALPAALGAQGADVRPAASAAKPSDVQSMDAILRALYDVISGPAGQRDWPRLQSLFAPGGRLIPTRRDSAGHLRLDVMTPDEFIKTASPVLAREPFYERQIGQTVDTFGAVTHVFSAYASTHEPNGAPFARGVNSIQLFNDGTRWYVVTIYWQAEQPGLTIPSKYLRP